MKLPEFVRRILAQRALNKDLKYRVNMTLNDQTNFEMQGPHYDVFTEKSKALLAMKDATPEAIEAAKALNILQLELYETLEDLTRYPVAEHKPRIEQLLEEQIKAAVGTDNREAWEECSTYLRTASSLLRRPKIINTFYGCDELQLADMSGFFTRVNEVGGVLKTIPITTGDQKVVGINPYQKVEGTPTTIQLDGKVGKDEIGQWHTHPLMGLPIPSAADLFLTSGMYINNLPHLIACEDGQARLYVHKFLIALASEALQEQAVKYTKADRAEELGRHGHPATSPEVTQAMMSDQLMYIGF